MSFQDDTLGHLFSQKKMLQSNEVVGIALSIIRKLGRNTRICQQVIFLICKRSGWSDLNEYM